MASHWKFCLILFLSVSPINGCFRRKTAKNNNTFETRKSSSTQDKIHVRNNFFVDSNGRVRFFHGINAVQKGPPWYPDWLMNETKLVYLREWGFNVVRLGTMWSGVQPTEGVTNDTYLDIIEGIINKFDTYGMYVILDMHQDVLSSYYGSYDGVPRWLIDKLPDPPHPYPWPFKQIPFWTDGYLTEAVSKGFQHIYNNTNGARDSLVEFWTIISRRYKNLTNVLGYEIINEPWCGDIYSNPNYLIPGNAGRYNLQPLHNVINEAIRKEDNVTIIFYEPVTWGVVSNGTLSGTGFTEVPGGLEFTNRSSLSYHYYCWVLGESDDHHTYPVWKKQLCDHILGPRVFSTVLQDVSVLGGATFLTEFGLCVPDGHNDTTDTIECEFVLSQADNHLQSWTYWDSQFFSDNGSIDWNSALSFSRPYARVIAGTPKLMHFDINNATFTFKYLPLCSNLETEIFVPLIHYPEGFVITKSPGVLDNFNNITRILYLTYTGNDSVITIILEPK